MEKNFLSPIKVRSAVDIVVDRLTQAIIDGNLKPGDRLPTELELAESFSVGRNTVREAIRILIAYGVLEIRRPEGTFVCDSFSPHGLNPLLYNLILNKDDSYNELIGLRSVIETGTMLLLLDQGISDAAIQQLRHWAYEIERTLKSIPLNIADVAHADISFHNTLAAATNNRLIVVVNDMLTKLTLASRENTIRQCVEQGTTQYLIDTHYNLIDKLQQKDIIELHNAVKDSYFYWKDINHSKYSNT